MRYMAPEFFVVHPIEFDAPEEDIFLLDLSFMSQAPEATMHVPTYANWLEKQDQTEAYKYMYKMLKLMHWQRSGNAWVLKTPHHMEHIDTILNVFLMFASYRRTATPAVNRFFLQHGGARKRHSQRSC